MYRQKAGVTQLARVTAFQAVGRRFESGLPLCMTLKYLLKIKRKMDFALIFPLD
jgi:hypothetical protein